MGIFGEEVMFDLLTVAKAYEMLHSPEITKNLNAESYLELCQAAGYGEEASKKAACEWGLKRLRNDLPM